MIQWQVENQRYQWYFRWETENWAREGRRWCGKRGENAPHCVGPGPREVEIGFSEKVCETMWKSTKIYQNTHWNRSWNSKIYDENHVNKVAWNQGVVLVVLVLELEDAGHCTRQNANLQVDWGPVDEDGSRNPPFLGNLGRSDWSDSIRLQSCNLCRSHRKIFHILSVLVLLWFSGVSGWSWDCHSITF